MAQRTFRSGLLAGTLALALIASGCGDSKEDKKSSGGTPSDSTKAGNEDLAKTSCGTLEHDTGAPKGGTYTDYAFMADSGTNTSFDPGVVQTLNESQITTSLFDGLTDFDFSDKCNPELKGAVAESWEGNADVTEFTFKLKDDVVFSDGTPVLPSSFKTGWERAGAPELASPYGYLIGYLDGGAAWLAGCNDDPAPEKDAPCKAPVDREAGLDAIVADDDAKTLTVKLSSPNADFPSIVSHPFFSPVNEADVAKIGDTTGWGTKGLTIGNGPFMLDSATPEEVVLVPNDKWAGNVYGDTEVHLDKLVFKSSIDVETAFQTFESGEGDSAPVPSGKYQDALGTYKKNTVEDPNVGSYFFDFGEDDPQVGGEKNVKLRQAISLAIDRQEINEKVYEGTRTIATGIVPPGIPGFKKDLAKYAKLDVAQAKTLYKEWQDAGGELTRPIRIDFNEGGSHGDVAQIIQANLKDNLGIETALGPVAEDYFRVVAEPGGCQICRSGWYADYPTYGNFMVDLFSKASIGGNNFARFDNPEFEAKIKEAAAETDDTKRGELYNEAEDILVNQASSAMPLVYYTGGQVFKDRVLNYDQPPLGIMLWERVAVEG
ncbi:MAG: ABC-type oligopeptide transport system, periplasmic component [Acidimicrobiales bacterium]|nr:ABC-type oligopeptide transport system, periplasmic component [Acidimicrobiales bacterium]